MYYIGAVVARCELPGFDKSFPLDCGVLILLQWWDRRKVDPQSVTCALKFNSSYSGAKLLIMIMLRSCVGGDRVSVAGVSYYCQTVMAYIYICSILVPC